MNWYRSSQLSLSPEDIASAAMSNGYNIGPVYHGSSDPDIKVFDEGRVGSIAVSDWGKGFYFTPSRGFADGYRENAVEKTDAEGDRLWDEYEEAVRELGTTPMMAGLDLGRDSKEYAYLNQFADRWSVYVKNLRDQEDCGRVYRSRGHDSILIVGEYEDDDSPIDLQEILVFEPSQIKSADEVTYYDDGNPISLSERFNASSDDIRY